MTGQHRDSDGEEATAAFQKIKGELAEPEPGTPEVPPAVIDVTAEEFRFATLTAEGLAALPEPLRRTRHKRQQIGRVLAFLTHRAAIPDLHPRAAAILMAHAHASELERMAGGREAVEFEGQEVKCRACRQSWTATPWQPYLNATTARDGICPPCLVLAESRQDLTVPVLDGAVVVKPKRASRAKGGANGSH